ncbi:MAG: hypothetical protein CM1200mP35_10600 [Chloroflexota bacterium]|nr:MAG: hypothetical protein CM1200mP35_10600 [Chloroflexota bacterium]
MAPAGAWIGVSDLPMEAVSVFAVAMWAGALTSFMVVLIMSSIEATE